MYTIHCILVPEIISFSCQVKRHVWWLQCLHIFQFLFSSNSQMIPKIFPPLNLIAPSRLDWGNQIWTEWKQPLLIIMMHFLQGYAFSVLPFVLPMFSLMKLWLLPLLLLQDVFDAACDFAREYGGLLWENSKTMCIVVKAEIFNQMKEFLSKQKQ